MGQVNIAHRSLLWARWTFLTTLSSGPELTNTNARKNGEDKGLPGQIQDKGLPEENCYHMLPKEDLPP